MKQNEWSRWSGIRNNSRFLILPDCHHKNLASKVLSLCRRRLQFDWQERFGFPVLLLETFVDPSRFVGTIYHAANWTYVGDTLGYRRVQGGYSTTPQAPKRVFVQPLQRNGRTLLAHPLLDERYQTGAPRMMPSAQQMESLPAFFERISDPRRRQGRRHPLRAVLAISAAAILCGARGYKAIVSGQSRPLFSPR